MAISTGWSICNSTSNSTMNHRIVLLDSFLHLKCTSVESPIGIGINCFLGGKKEYEVPEENSNGIEMNECKTEELTELVIERNSIMQKALILLSKKPLTIYRANSWIVFC